MSINNFISEVKFGGMARQNRFTVLFTPPVDIDSLDLQKVLLFCDTSQLPGVNFSTVQNRTYGEFREIPYEKLYDNLTMSFYVDTDMKVKSLFDSWINQIQNPVTRNFNYYNNYTCEMTIEVQDILDRTRYQLTLYECYPKTLGAVSLDYSSKEIMKLPVTMQYKYWTATAVTQLDDDTIIPNAWFEQSVNDFTGFQEALNRTLGTTGGDFLSGSGVYDNLDRLDFA
jgi:hypothetical protein